MYTCVCARCIDICIYNLIYIHTHSTDIYYIIYIYIYFQYTYIDICILMAYCLWSFNLNFTTCIWSSIFRIGARDAQTANLVPRSGDVE